MRRRYCRALSPVSKVRKNPCVDAGPAACRPSAESAVHPGQQRVRQPVGSHGTGSVGLGAHKTDRGGGLWLTNAQALGILDLLVVAGVALAASDFRLIWSDNRRGNRCKTVGLGGIGGL
jgi:hypothetical protein